jgi:tetratricopeptide (TPR) repeat protein
MRALDLEDADIRGARAAYEACLAGDCTHLEARINLGRLLHLEGMHSDAETTYRDTQETDAILCFNLAVLMEDLGRESDAVNYYRQALIHEPGMADAHFNLSLLQERAGDAQSAFRHLLAYRRLVEAHRDPAEFSETE